MFKKILCNFAAITLLTSALQGVIVFASNYTQVLNCSFEVSDVQQVEKFKGMLYDLTSGQYQAVSSTLTYAENNTYNIGRYYKNTQTNRIVKFDQPINRADETYVNKYLEVEYDIMSFGALNPNLSPSTAGAASVLLAVKGDNGRYSNFSGLEFNNTGNIYKFWDRNVSFGTFGNNEWIRCKFVMLLNNNGTVPKTSDFTYYINGKMMGTGSDYHGTTEQPLTVIDGLRLYCSTADFGIDNLKISIYSGDNAPVEKGGLVSKIREFEKTYGDISENQQANGLLTAAKSTYENTSATAQDIANAIDGIAEATALLHTDIDEIISYDFETAENQQAFRNGLAANSENGGNISFSTGDSVFGIGTSASNGVSHNNYTFETPFDRNAATSKNLYLEVEFDMMPVSVNPDKECLGAVTLISGGKGTYKHCGGIEFYYNKASANTGYLTSFWRTGNRLAAYDFGKWYRCKIVVLLNDNGVLNNTGVIDYYINGEKILTDNVYTSDIQVIECLRLYASNSSFKVDNISVRTYKKSNVPAEKGRLVSKLREFAGKYENYQEVPEVKALFDSAAAVYYNKEAGAEEVEAAIEAIRDAEMLAFPAVRLIKQDFEQSPSYFFDSIISGGVKSDYSANSAKPDTIAYNSDATYGIDNAMFFTPAYSAGAQSSAVKNFDAVSLDSISFVSAYFDVKKTGANMGISLASGDTNAACITIDGENITYLNGNDIIASDLKSSLSDWVRIRFNVNCAEKTYSVYADGELVANNALLNQGAESISSLKLTTTCEGNTIGLDNVNVITYDNIQHSTPNKGKLIKVMRTAYILLSSDILSREEKGILQKVFDTAASVYKKDMPSISDVTKSEEKISFLSQNLSADISGAKQIIIPGAGVDLENVIVQFNLHYGSQEGDASYKELFFDNQCNRDFSDVKFLDYKGCALNSDIISTGSYDFISDGNLGFGVSNIGLSDGTIVSTKDGYVALSHDNALTWQKTNYKGRLYFADRNDNIYYAVTGGAGAGLYKLRAADNYTDDVLVIDCSDAVEQGCSEITWGPMVQDDDGYIYAGRYTEEWIGAVLYVSDETGENFRAVDFRADKQHCHNITVNRNVYPNEVYVTYDDSSQQPLCQVTVTHAGYEEIKNNAHFMHPTAARSTGTEGSNKKRPANETAEKLLSNSQKHFVQVPVPFANSDYLGYFGVIDKGEDKFYTASNGKRYTTKDNVYALGYGEANILGGPGLYKTTDVMNPDKYYPVIENAQGARIVMSPAENVIIWGGLAGRYCMTPQLCISYDDGETWNTAYTEGYNYSGGAGNGPFRMVSKPFIPKGSNEKQVLMAGWGYSNTIRAKFGNEYSFGYTYVTIDKLPAEGMKIFVTLDKSNKEITKYEYSTINGTEKKAVKSTKYLCGEGSAVKFASPVTGSDTKGVIYCFDVDTASKTAVAVHLIATDGIITDSALKLILRTDNGEIYNGETDNLIGQTEALKSSHFSVKIIADYLAHTCDIYIDGVLAADNVQLDYLLDTPTEIAMSTMDLSSQSSANSLRSEDYDTATSENPIIVYYSDIGYAEIQDNEAQFLVVGISYKDSQNNPVPSLAQSVTLENVTIYKVDSDIESAVLLVAFYLPDNRLADCKIVNINGSGTYDVGLTAHSNGLIPKLIMVKSLQTIEAVSIVNCI